MNAPAQISPEKDEKQMNSAAPQGSPMPMPGPQGSPVPMPQGAPMPMQGRPPMPMPMAPQGYPQAMPGQMMMGPPMNAPFIPESNVTACSEPTLATCKKCFYTGMTVTKKNTTTCQLTSGIILLFTLPLVGVIVLFMGHDTQHVCARCGDLIGTKPGCC